MMTTQEQPLMVAGASLPDTLVIGVVEDDASFLRALGRLLSGAGFTVAAFASAEEFLASDSAATTSCLVLDIHLGGMSGFDLQQHLGAVGIQIPTIFMTGHDDPATRKRAGSGAAYLRKPFRERALLGAIHQALEQRDV
jgi:FixJ family two-component response regulator